MDKSADTPNRIRDLLDSVWFLVLAVMMGLFVLSLAITALLFLFV